MTGSWSDGHGGSLRLTADGRASAVRIADYPADGDPSKKPVLCSGSGTWSIDPGQSRWDAELRIDIDNCDFYGWSSLGTPAHPKLYYYIGDPDSGGLYTLTKRT